jgi:acetyl-CoA carboxylase biotin carboxyl carrier protein
MEAVDKVRQLIEIMAEHDLAELEVEEPDLKIRIKKYAAAQFVPPGFAFPNLQQPPGYYPALQMPATQEHAAPAPAKKEENLEEITSPMVGTFYRSSSPGSEAYVSIGSEVAADSVVCIIEAMKVMNEIKAEVSGTIVEILVEDAEPVEFGQVLFLVEPSVP